MPSHIPKGGKKGAKNPDKKPTPINLNKFTVNVPRKPEGSRLMRGRSG